MDNENSRLKKLIRLERGIEEGASEEDQLMEMGLAGRNLIHLPGKKLDIDKEAYVNPYSLLIGEISVDANATIWPGVIIRADDAAVSIGRGAAILDKAFIEAPKGHDVTIGAGALISHGAIVHGGSVDDGALLGIGSILLEGAVVEEGAIVAAGAVVPPGHTVPAKTMALGIPAKSVRSLTDEEIKKTREQVKQVEKKAREYGTYYIVGKGML